MPKLIGQIENIHGTIYDFYQEVMHGTVHFSLVPAGSPPPRFCAYCDIQWLFRTKCISKY